MCYYVYILKSLRNGRFYVGQTKDLLSRVMEHNIGKSGYTRFGVPWKLIWTKELDTRTEAMGLEKSVKARGIKRYLSDIGILGLERGA
jgi:putative endonuclease